MKNKRSIGRLRLALAVLLTAAILLGAADYLIDDTLTLRYGEALPAMGAFPMHAEESAAAVWTGDRTWTYRAQLFGMFPLKRVDVSYLDDVQLCPGGTPFGAKIFSEGLLVTGFGEVDTPDGARRPAYEAGIRVRDLILKINAQPVATAEDMARLIAESGGEPLEITVRRGEDVHTVTVTPLYSVAEGEYRTGMWVRDSIAGIGTITYVDPRDGSFAGLGHGICDAASGALLPLSRGIVVDVTISGVQKGSPDMPGELKGYFSSGRIGSICGNSPAGVFGLLTEPPLGADESAAVPIALKQEIRDGEATLRCTLTDGAPQDYSVMIRKIKNSTDLKNMEITVTDPALLAVTGGIVQGMSGSPLLQDGRLIGAVTHVLINDPTKGYGIYIENMLTQKKQILP